MKEQETGERRCCLDADQVCAQLKLPEKVQLPLKKGKLGWLAVEHIQISES